MALDATILAIFGEPPDGIDLDEQIVTAYNIVVIVALVVAAIFVGLRFYVRNMKGSNLWWDDWTIVFSVVRRLVNGMEGEERQLT